MQCGQPLEYRAETTDVICLGCNKKATSPIICPDGHYICDTCHSATALERLPAFAARSTGMAPEDILEELLELPGLPMHGPEHHAMAALALLLACHRQDISLQENFIEEAVRRSMQIPGGSCGYLGACGAGISLGIAVSLVTGATPVSGLARGLANRATAAALAACGDDDARCCKRALRHAITIGRQFFDLELGIEFPEANQAQSCWDIARNGECARERCPYYHKNRRLHRTTN
jgi:hypothetical protein